MLPSPVPKSEGPWAPSALGLERPLGPGPPADARLVARYAEDKGAFLELRVPVDERYVCPSCGTKSTVKVDPVPGGVASSTCGKCGQPLTFTRALDGLRIRLSPTSFSSQHPVTEELIGQVRTRLPAQPWPVGIHREIALELGVPPTVVSRTIEELIRRGDFYPQENGVVHHPATDEQPTR